MSKIDDEKEIQRIADSIDEDNHNIDLDALSSWSQRSRGPRGPRRRRPQTIESASDILNSPIYSTPYSSSPPAVVHPINSFVTEDKKPQPKPKPAQKRAPIDAPSKRKLKP